MTQQQSTTVLIIGILTLLSLIPWAIALRRARVFGDWDLTSTLVLLIGVLANLPATVYTIVTGRAEHLDPLGDTVIGFPSWVNRIGSLANGLILLVCVLFVVGRLLVARARINVAPLIATVIVLALAASDALHGQPLWTPRQLTLLAALLAAAVARPGRSALLGGAAVVMVYTVLGGIESFVEPATVVRSCRGDNPCGELGILYAGVFTNENIFSLLVVASIPFVWLGLRGWVRVPLVCYLAFVAIATGSVLASVTAIAAVALLALLRPRLPDQPDPAPNAGVTPGRLLLGGTVVAGVTAVGLAVPLRPAHFGDLGLRAAIWDLAKEEWTRSPLLGYGSKAWSAKYQSGEIPAAVSPSLHNQWIDTLYAGGIVGLLLFAVLLAYLLFRGGTRGFPVAACVLLPVLLASVLERPWSFGISNSMTFALVAATLLPVQARARAGTSVRQHHHSKPRMMSDV
ncbi:O-antigen ligase [Streptomyces sp. TRM68367]|uniref:O-antigen ligase family protein n=1 Tax=Streptomyces sp. TRM68367 TaxID=2758415 RepID=UPI00165BD60F|nr:O-antigen ligase family protein [Streptomyces sp. TRM68367]MBC9727987.1 O-antigen ligase family protein [Streptomyces sp. TRM68367]